MVLDSDRLEDEEVLDLSVCLMSPMESLTSGTAIFCRKHRVRLGAVREILTVPPWRVCSGS